MHKSGRVGVVGLGYVGLPLAILAKSKGYDVIGIDNDKKKVGLINLGISPIDEKYVKDRIKKNKIQASTKMSDLSSTDIVLICVPTPVKKDQPDLSILENASQSVAKFMKKGTLVIIESTINPGVCDEVVIPALEQASSMKAGEEFHIAHCPERINPGDDKWHIDNINRVVGSNSPEGLKRALKFYRSIINAEVKPMGSLKEAEAVKIIENSFRDVNIAFVNELAMSFHKIGVDLENVIDGAATKPFAFMPHRPGCGVGGHCIPVDPYYLIEYARGFGFNHDFLSLARRINNGMPEFTVELTQDALDKHGFTLKGSTIALLGLAYKPNVDDDRESPAYEIRDLLESKGARVISYDPHLPDKSDVKSLEEAIKPANAVIVATGHDEFKKIASNFSLKAKSLQAIIDGRNLLRAHRDKIPSTITYQGIGISR